MDTQVRNDKYKIKKGLEYGSHDVRDRLEAFSIFL